MKKAATNNPDGRPLGDYGKRSSRTMRIPDKLWIKIPGNKSEFIIELLAKNLPPEQ